VSQWPAGFGELGERGNRGIYDSRMEQPEEPRRPTIEELLSRALLVRHRSVPQDVVPPAVHYDDSLYQELLDGESGT
jgi:hypothetical protein